METSNLLYDTLSKFPGSYPTYEEWKPMEILVKSNEFDGSYPTYEEWKLISIQYN